MIDTALLLLKNELAAYIKEKDSSVNIAIDNISLFETPSGDSLANSVIISVVNIEEEATLKNVPALKRPFASTALYENPPVFLNLYVLFTSNYSGDNYILALKRLSYVIRFLQSKSSFAAASSVATGTLDLTDPEVAGLKFSLDLYTLTFEQINHLWGSLGGRQVPFAMYKLRLVSLTERVLVREVPVIEEIETLISKTKSS